MFCKRDLLCKIISTGITAGKIFKKNPDLVHVERRNLGNYSYYIFLERIRYLKLIKGTANIGYELYKTYWLEWKTFDTLNLYLNQNYQEMYIPLVKGFQETNLSSKNFNCTFTYCEMCRKILEKIK